MGFECAGGPIRIFCRVPVTVQHLLEISFYEREDKNVLRTPLIEEEKLDDIPMILTRYCPEIGFFEAPFYWICVPFP